MNDLTTTAPTHHAPGANGRGVEDSLAAILWGGRWIILGCVLACASIALIYLVKARRVYGATARVLIRQSGGRPLSMANQDPSRLIEGPDEGIPSHAMILRSPLVVGRAVDSLGPDALPSLGPAERGWRTPLQQAIVNLSVTRPDRQARILQVDYRCYSADEAVRVVAAILESYRAFLEDADLKNNSEVIALIARARDDLRVETEELERKYLEFRRRSPLLTTDGLGRPFINRRVDELDKAQNEAKVKAIHLRAQLDLGRKLSGEGVGMWSIAYAMGQLGGPGGQDAGVLAQLSREPPSDYVRLLTQEQQQIADRLGPENTRVKEIQEQVAAIKAQSRDARGRLEQSETRDLLSSVKEGLAAVETIRGEIKAEFERDVVAAKAAEIDLITEANLRGALDRQRALFNTVVEQLKQAKFAREFGSIRAETIEPANALPKPVHPAASLTMALALAVGLTLGAGAALAADLMDPRIRSLPEMRRILRLPVLAQIPRLPDDQVRRTGPVSLLSQMLPRSAAAEEFKVARAAIELIRRGCPMRVILVTSLNSADGRSVVASNLAISLAQAGRKVLLVDADLRRPSLHKDYQLPREQGLSQLLRGDLPLARVVQATRIANLDLITAGAEAPNPSELLSSPRLHQFFEEARRTYDTVVVDSPPLLRVADPSIIGAVADGILLTVQATGTRREDAARAVEVLGALGTPVLGSVINGAGPKFQAAPPTTPSVGRRGGRIEDIRSDLQLSYSPSRAVGGRS